ncbi:MAG: DUF445 family protein [Phycisphaerae bacterium]
MSFSLLSLLVLCISLLLPAAGFGVPAWLASYLLPLLLACAVGYLTNLIAITMLFRPYDKEDKHPVGLVPGWKQGLVPKHKHELGQTAGQQVSDKLLTAETIADEVRVLIQRALADEELQDKLRYSLGPPIREKLPELVEDLTPSIMDFLRGVVRTGFTRENLELLFDKVIEPWVKTPENLDSFATWSTETLKNEIVPAIMEWLQQMAEEYKQRGFWKKAAVSFAEWTRALDWEAVQEQIVKKLEDQSTRSTMVKKIQELFADLRKRLQESELSPMLRTIQGRASDFVITVVEQHLKTELPDLGHRIADSRRFWRWLSDRALPSIQPYMVSWLAGDGVEAIKQNFDVAGRVETAIDGMDVQKVHEMVNEASARHLGAIQVLGFMLGAVAGIFLLLV